MLRQSGRDCHERYLNYPTLFLDIRRAWSRIATHIHCLATMQLDFSDSWKSTDWLFALVDNVQGSARFSISAGTHKTIKSHELELNSNCCNGKHTKYEI